MFDKSIGICFQGGSYGSYIKWLLYQLLINDSDVIITPWGKYGSSHAQKEYIKSDYVLNQHLEFDDISEGCNYRINTIHPVPGVGHNFIENVKIINNHLDYVVIPYPDINTYLLNVNNYMYKIWDDLWGDNSPLHYIDINDLKSGWGVDDPINAPTWIIREYFSYNIFTSWESQCSWYAPDHLYGPDFHYIFTSDLLHNFAGTIENLRKFLSVDWIRDPIDLLPYHQYNVSKQQYINQDNVVKQIFESINNNNPISWNPQDLTIVSEAFIQKSLRDQGIALKCNGLNNFPVSTNELLEIFE